MTGYLEQKKILVGKDYGEAVASAIRSAVHTIDVIMFEWRWLDNDPSARISEINRAVVEALRRGVKIRALVNYTAQLEKLRSLGVVAHRFPVQKLMHGKMLIVDSETLFIGSHNFTQTALASNLEISLMVSDPVFGLEISALFSNLWQSRL